MRGTLPLYLNRLFFSKFAGILLAMTAFILSLDLMVNAKSITNSRPGDTGAFMDYAALRLPEIISQSIPISTLLAMLMLTAQLIRNGELVAIWSIGLSPFRTILALVPAAALIGICQLAIDGVLVPTSISKLNSWGVGDYGKNLTNETSDGAFWLRSGNDIVRLPERRYDVENLSSLIVFRRDGEGNLLARIDAGGLRQVGEDDWVLEDVTIRDATNAKISHAATLDWETELPFDELKTMATHPRELSLVSLFTFVRDGTYGLFPPFIYQTWLNEKLAASLTPFLLVVLIVLVAQRFERTGGIAILFAWGIAIGFAFFILDRASLAIGEAGLVPPVIAGWAPSLALAAVAGTFGFHYESRGPTRAR